MPGCEYTVLGGYVSRKVAMGRGTYDLDRYRRGKTESNDVDIVFTHADPGREKDALATLVKRMNRRGPSIST